MEPKIDRFIKMAKLKMEPKIEESTHQNGAKNGPTWNQHGTKKAPKWTQNRRIDSSKWLS